MNNEEKEYIKLTPFKMQILQSFPFIDADFDALTNYELLCKVVDYLNKTIDNVDVLHDEVEEYIGKFNELKAYVDNYFDNLNVQEEINNKLDEMAEDGSLTNLIKAYVDPIYEAYEDEINEDISDFKSDINEEISDFKSDVNEDITEQNTEITNFKSNINGQINTINEKVNSAISGSPKGVYATLSDLQTADPDHDYIYVVTADGKWYYYNSTLTAWTIGGTYQSTGIADNSITFDKLTSEVQKGIITKENDIDVIYPDKEITLNMALSPQGALILGFPYSAVLKPGKKCIKGSTIGCTSGHQFQVAGFSNDTANPDSLVEYSGILNSTSTYTVQNDCYIVIGIRNTDSSDATMSIVDELILNIMDYKVDILNNTLSGINSKLKQVETNIDKLYIKKDIQLGYVISNTGALSSGFSNSAVLKPALKCEKGTKISCTSGHQFQVAEYNSSEVGASSYIVGSRLMEYGDTYTVKNNCYILVSIRNEDLSTATDDIIDELEFYYIVDKNFIDIPLGEVKKETVTYLPSVEDNTRYLKLTNYESDYYSDALTFGGQYLYHYYTKLCSDNETATILLTGDSTTQNGFRTKTVRKILDIAKFPVAQRNIITQGYGSRSTQEFAGTGHYYVHDSDITDFPNGIIDHNMESNPDLLIIGYGLNDGNRGYNGMYGTTTTLQERLEMFKDNMEEVLKRIRGNVAVNGRPAYNKSAEELSIILCSNTDSQSNQREMKYDEWGQYVSIILKELARKYKCAFVDFAKETMDRSWSPNHIDGNTSQGAVDHMNEIATMQYASIWQDLIAPICMWRTE